MEQVFVANPKGGCGKTTIATQLAGFFANQGKAVLLLDHDAQRSSTDWLRSRPSTCANICSVIASVDACVDLMSADIVVRDMPAAWSLDHVSDLIHKTDKVIIPVLASPNDIKACLRFVMSLDRSGMLETGVHVGVVANRVRSRTRYYKILTEFLNAIELPLITSLRDTQNYVQAMDKGLSIFDNSTVRMQQDRTQWESIINWLDCA